MLPFSDIDFFLFAGIYLALLWLWKVATGGRSYNAVTFVLTLIYLVFYFKYTLVALAYVLLSFLYIRYVSQRINHRLVSALILAAPMVLVKAHINPSLLYFAGLSFVSFRAIQVCIDHTKDTPLNFISFFNFLFFIPSLYIGPLDRFKRFADNCNSAFKNMSSDMAFEGLEQFAKGVLYKFVIAELIARYWLKDNTHDPMQLLERCSDIYAYALFLFFDFAGYSAMAVGMANLTGISLPFNFNKPFSAVNPPEFWQRWHASLTSWLTDYFFKPLYKWLGQRSKLKKYPVTRQNIAIFFTFFLMGVWNGFEPNFVWSGIIYGIYSVVHNTYAVQCRKQDKDVVFGNLSPSVVRYISIFITFNLVCLALYVFSGRYE